MNKIDKENLVDYSKMPDPSKVCAGFTFIIDKSMNPLVTKTPYTIETRLGVMELQDGEMGSMSVDFYDPIINKIISFDLASLIELRDMLNYVIKRDS